MIEVRAIRRFFRDPGVNIFIDDVPTTPRQSYGTAEPIVFKRNEELFQPDPSPAVSLEPQAAQKLIDDLWDCGLRPSEGTGSAGQLAAVQKHLEDFRTIVFKKLGIERGK